VFINTPTFPSIPHRQVGMKYTGVGNAGVLINTSYLLAYEDGADVGI
jgi:hypothetical protein